LRNRAFPAIEEVAKFYSDWLIEDPRDGSLISAFEKQSFSCDRRSSKIL